MVFSAPMLLSFSLMINPLTPNLLCSLPTGFLVLYPLDMRFIAFHPSRSFMRLLSILGMDPTVLIGSVAC